MEAEDGESPPEITLRPMDPSDGDDLMEWAADDRVTRSCLWNTYTSREQAMDYITKLAIPHPWLRAICLKNRAIGSISVTPSTGEGRRRAELGYVLGFRHWGKEITTRAVNMVASAIFREWSELERLEALVDVENLGSQRVLEKAGFRREGVLRKYMVVKGRPRDTVMFSLLSTDPTVLDQGLI